MTLHPYIHMMNAVALPPQPEGGAPEFIHLLPAAPDGLVRTEDPRGPYRIDRPLQQIIDLSFARAPRLEIDINHSTYKAAPRGERSDAYGWIVAMEAREDGIWGRVEWTEEGRKLVEGRAYRGISPAIRCTPSKAVLLIENASLVNRPNLRGLTALNMEGGMELLQKLAEMLGLGEGASEDDVLAAVKGMKGEASEPAMQAQMTEIGLALGLKADAGAAAILNAAKASAEGKDQVITALQAEVQDLGGKLNAVTEAAARTKAETFVDGEIARGRAGVKPLRDHYVSMHMQDPARVEKEIGAMPVLGGSGIKPPAPDQGGTVQLNAEQRHVAGLLGIPEEKFAATLAAERKEAR